MTDHRMSFIGKHLKNALEQFKIHGKSTLWTYTTGCNDGAIASLCIRILDDKKPLNVRCSTCESSFKCLMDKTDPLMIKNKRYPCYLPANIIKFIYGGCVYLSFIRDERLITDHGLCSQDKKYRAYIRALLFALKENFEELNLSDTRIDVIGEQFTNYVPEVCWKTRWIKIRTK